MSETEALWRHHRALLTHFDGYSAALHFAKWGGTLLAPGPLPEGAAPWAAPSPLAPAEAGEAVKQAVARQFGLNEAELVLVAGFDQGFDSPDGPLRVHLLRFETFEPPRQALASSEGVFKQISELRGSARVELPLLREVFNLIIGAGGGRA